MPRWLVVFDDLETWEAATPAAAVRAALLGGDENAYPLGGKFAAINVDELPDDMRALTLEPVALDEPPRFRTAPAK